jgi:hypothetical protein
MSEADQDLAVAWLANERLYSGRAPDDNSVPAGYDFAIDGEVSELVCEDADPRRGGKLGPPFAEVRSTAAVRLGSLLAGARVTTDAAVSQT